MISISSGFKFLENETMKCKIKFLIASPLCPNEIESLIKFKSILMVILCSRMEAFVIECETGNTIISPLPVLSAPATIPVTIYASAGWWMRRQGTQTQHWIGGRANTCHFQFHLTRHWNIPAVYRDYRFWGWKFNPKMIDLFMRFCDMMLMKMASALSVCVKLIIMSISEVCK